MDQIVFASATTMARAIRNKEVSSSEVVDAHLRRIDEVNPIINAVVQIAAERARTEAKAADEDLARGRIRGPLHGVPLTIKDALDTEGIVSTAGTLGRKGHIPKEDATLVRRLRDAGGIVLGKTNLPELSLLWESDNLVYGRCNNPYGLDRSPGGSSGGEAAIIAAGGSPLGMGSDSGGSIRQPAHNCGIAGIKPTSGCVPRTGHFGFIGGILDFRFQVGPMARYVEDLILSLPIIVGPDYIDPAIVPVPLGDPDKVDIKGLRVSFHTDNGIAPPTPETAKVIRNAAQALADAGATVEEDLPKPLTESNDLIWKLRWLEGDLGIRALLEEAGTTQVHPLTEQWMRTIRPEPSPTSELIDVIGRWDTFRSTMLGYIKDWDVIISPSASEPA